MNIFFDTETTGVPRNYNAPVSDVDNYPRLVQLGYVLVNNGKVLHQYEAIIKPDGFEIPQGASRVNGISTEKALNEGEDLVKVLDEFKFWAKASDKLIGHNVKFDCSIMGAEYWRKHGFDPLAEKKKVCTMLSGAKFVGIPGNYGKYKYPKLQELYRALFLKDFPQTHTARDDILHTVECYDEMVKRGIIV